jgi:hypothetical protein
MKEESRLVECSCGRMTRIRLEGGREVAASSAWENRTKEEADLYEQSSGRNISPGWYCGTPDHEQKGA